MVVVPGFTPVTTPALFTVATPVFDDVHGLTAAGVPDPVNVVVDPTHTVNVPVIVGCALTVTVAVLLHPLLLVYVIVVVPAATPVTTPALLTVATPVFDDVHGLTAAGVPDPVNVVVDPTHTVNVPVIVGCALTVTVAVLLHPLLLVYVIVVVPAATPVTTPALLTVATPVFDDVHGLTAAGVPDPVNVVVDPTHTVNVPVIVGCALTVTVAVLLHPLLLVYVIVVVPGPCPVTTPALLTVATPAFDDVHGLTAAGVPDPVNVVVDPTHTVNVPVIVGCALTVIITVLEHPLLLVYVIVVVPGPCPVTTPALLTVATPVFDDVHGLTAAGVPDPVKVVVAPAHTVNVPPIVGCALTVIVTV